MKKILYWIGCVLISFVFAIGQGYAADVDNLRGNSVGNANNFQNLSSHKKAAMLGLSADDELVVIKKRKDANNKVHVRYQQLYKGIPVWGKHIIGHYNANGEVEKFTGKKVRNIGKDLKAVPDIKSLNANYLSSALQRAKDMTGANSAVADNMVFSNEKVELYIYVDANNRARLAYYATFMMDTAVGGSPSVPTYLMDADTLDVIQEWNNLQDVEVGTGPGGNQKTGQYEYGTNFGFLDVEEDGTGLCTMNTSDVKTINLNHSTNLSGNVAYQFDCPRNTYQEINGAFSPLNDAHYFGGVVFGLYLDWYGTAPLTGQLILNVHYGNNYENAFWNPSSQQMAFGDGFTRFHPLVSLDVVGHEVSHGFTSQNSNLIYSQESGGMNEAFSDMAGEASENYSRGSNDWDIGADIFKAAGQALRYMSNPPQDGKSIDNYADYYNGLDVHYSSGLYNKAFYVLATTTSWDVRKAFEVMVKANQDYWMPDSTFAEGVCGAVDAANDLGYSTSDVEAAFTVVGLSCLPPPPESGSVSGRFTNPDGKKLPGITFWDIYRYPATVTTDTNGDYFIGSYSVGDWVWFNVFGTGSGYSFTPSGWNGQTFQHNGSDMTGFDYVGTMPGTVSGRITRSNGAGVPNITFWDVSRYPETVTTDAEGYFSIHDYTSGDYVYFNMFATGTNFTFAASGWNGQSFQQDGSHMYGRNYIATLPGSVSGRFTDPEGIGLANITFWDIYTYPQTITTNANGYFTITDRGAGDWVWFNVNATGSGYNFAASGWNGQSFQHDGGEMTGFDYIGSIPGTVSGCFKDNNGVPLPNITFWDVSRYPGTVTTDANGCYALHDYVAGNWVWFNVNGTNSGYNFSPSGWNGAPFEHDGSHMSGRSYIGTPQ